MVNAAAIRAVILVAAWDKLSALDRARLQMGMLALVVLMIGVIVFVLLMGRWARRQVSRPLPPVRHTGELLAHKSLVASCETSDRTSPAPHDQSRDS